MDERSDETLLDLYFLGDAEAFQTFYRRHSGRVLGYAKSKGISEELAEEIRQESFLRLHRSIHSYEKGRPALNWFFTIVQNALVDALRQSQRLGKLRSELAQAESPFHTESDPSGEHDLEPALASLSADQRKVVELKVIEGHSFREISATLEKNEVSLRKTFERAKEKMKRALQGGD